MLTFKQKSATMINHTNLYKGNTMFESIEIRKVANGFIVAIHTEDDTKEYVYDTSRKAMRVLKQYLEGKVEA
jgi:hypothetical protein